MGEKRGRPAKNPDEVKKSLTIRLDDEEREKLERYAQYKGISNKSEVIRAWINAIC